MVLGAAHVRPQTGIAHGVIVALSARVLDPSAAVLLYVLPKKRQASLLPGQLLHRLHGMLAGWHACIVARL